MELTLGHGPARGADRSMIKRFFPEYLRVAIPMGLQRNGLKGGVENGPTMYPLDTSLSSREATVTGSLRADWRLGAT